MNKEIRSTLEYLRGMYPDGLYVGGSFALTRALKSSFIEPKDIDIFILGPRKIESWVLHEFLQNHFQYVDSAINRPDYYKIDKQYRRVKAQYCDIKFDLIFCDLSIQELVNNNTASTLSKMYYKVDYSDELINLTPLSKQHLKYLVIDEVCFIDESMATEAHLKKIKDRCNQLNLRIKKDCFIARDIADHS